MKVEVLAQSLIAPVARDGAAQAAAWRQAMEQALDHALRDPRGAASSPRLRDEGPPADAAVRAAAPIGASAIELAPITSRAAPASPPGASAAAMPVVPASASAGTGGAAAGPVTAGPPPLHAMVALPTVRPVPAAAALRAPPPRQEPPSWPPFATHANLTGNQVRASVRDARLSAAEAEALRRALVRQLGSAGLELAELRINGQDVVDKRRS